MADIYLHSRLAEEVIKELDYEFDKKLVFMGAQGPDPLYYNMQSKEHKDYRYYADRMHDTNTKNLFKNMINHIKHHNNQITYSWLVGFICHYALDVKIHPYVYHNVGVYKKDKPETHKYRGLHLKFERSIDAVMIEKELGFKANKLSLHKTYFTQKLVPLDVMKVMEHTLKQTYGKDNGGTMYLIAVNKMYGNVKKIIKDRFGIKKQLYKIIDLFTKQDMFFKDLSFYNHIEQYDFLNEQKKTWHHPITNESFNSSVEDLFNEAKVFALELIKKTDACLKDACIDDLDSVFTNLSFNSGLDCDLHDEMKYFNIYRK